MRGGERMVRSYLKGFKEADIYALFGNRRMVKKEFEGVKIRFSALQLLPGIRRFYRYTLPIWPLIFKFWNLRKYDLIISFSSSFAKCVKGGKGTEHIAVIMTPPRYLWDMSGEYIRFASKFGRAFFRFFSTPLRIIDANSAKVPTRIVAISKYTARRICKYYGRNADLIVYPPVTVPNRLPDQTSNQNLDELGDFYLAISPFEENKNPEFLFKSAVSLGYSLVVIGGGSLFQKYTELYQASKNILFLPTVSDDEKWMLLARAKALLMFGIEDCGTIQIEAVYAGCPVIAYADGGVKETLVNGQNSVILNELTLSELGHAMKRVEVLSSSVEQFRSLIPNSLIVE